MEPNDSFLINKEKSNFIPRQECNFLGFVFNSLNMSLGLTHEKRTKIYSSLEKFSNLQTCKIRDFAHLIGILTAACPAIAYGWLYTKLFERQKYLSLIQTNDFESTMEIPKSLEVDFNWWLQHIGSATNPIRQGKFKIEIFTDASKTGWGVYCAGHRAHGFWKETEQKWHINHLELLTAFLGLKCFAKDLKDCEVLLRIDNTTAISYVNKFGGTQYPKLNAIARDLWQWCEKRRIWVFASYIKSSENKEADAESRRKTSELEWALADQAFTEISRTFGYPVIDLFATRVNAKCARYISWHNDPEAETIDAFTISWENLFFYAFPPFSMILKTLQKICCDKAEGIVVVPYWTTQPWYPLFKSLLIKQPIIFQPDKKLLLSPFRLPHPLHPKLTLVAGQLSAKLLGKKVFRKKP